MSLVDDSLTMMKQFTVSGYVLSAAGDKLLLVAHKKLGKWLPPGGHVDEGETPQAAVVREVLEETGVAASIVRRRIVDLALDGITEEQLDDPASMSCQLIPARPGEPSHIHMDMAFLLAESAAHTEVVAQLSEVSEAGWFALAEIEQLDTFAGVRAHARVFLGRPE